MELQLDRSWNGERAPDGIGGSARLDLDGHHLRLSWDLALAGPVPRIPLDPPGFLDGLWGWDVVEIFLRSASDPRRYLEIEVGPAGHWLALAFDGVRRRAAVLDDLLLEARHEVDRGRWRGQVAIPAIAIERHAGPVPWRGLVAAVLGGGAAGERTFLAWPALPGERPDFHQPDAWSPLVL